MGTYGLKAVYSGSSTVAPSTSSLLSVTIGAGFTVTAPTAPTPIPDGGTANIGVTVPSLGGAFNLPVTFSATGLPAGAKATFNPPVVTPGSKGAQTVMTVSLSTLSAVRLTIRGTSRWRRWVLKRRTVRVNDPAGGGGCLEGSHPTCSLLSRSLLPS